MVVGQPVVHFEVPVGELAAHVCVRLPRLRPAERDPWSFDAISIAFLITSITSFIPDLIYLLRREQQ